MAETISKEKLDEMLEEISVYEIKLVPDPTLPHLGMKYLQKVLSECRNYTNRVLFYLQAVMRSEMNLKRESDLRKLDFELKMQDLLADDMTVRARPSISDRNAVAGKMLTAEKTAMAEIAAELSYTQQTKAILDNRYKELQKTSMDIKLQRSMVRDDISDQLSGGEGYSKPQTNQDGSVQGNLRPPVNVKPIDPSDILNDDTRPQDMPVPKDAEHAGQIAAFLSRHPEKDKETRNLTGKHCMVCKKPQFMSIGGITCDLGHGGADSVEDEAPKNVTNDRVDAGLDYGSLLV